jgi:ketol-acid reductoisomerase
MKKIYYDKDCDASVLANETVAVIGYGNQGHAQAQNMRDSEINVIIGARENSKSGKKAVKDGFRVFGISEAAKQASIIHLLAPDTVQKEIYYNDIHPFLNPGNALVFAHGFNIHFDLIKPSRDIDVYLVSPKGPGHQVRKLYHEGGGVAALFAVHQDVTGKCRKRALAHALAIGSGRIGIIETSFREETETDLFGEQTVLCGGIIQLIQYAFETLTEAGYAPEAAYFECLHEVKLIVDLLYKGGITKMHHSISDTARWGGLISGPRVIDKSVKRRMKKILNDIQKEKGASFAKKWIKETENGFPKLRKLTEKDLSHPVEVTGKNLRSMMHIE